MTRLRFKLLALAISTASFAAAAPALGNNGYYSGGAMMAGTSPAAQPVIRDGLYEVPLNKNELVRLPAPASAVIIADPSIADVSVHSSDTLLVIGRGYGETNLIVLDELGRTMMNADIVVSASHGNGQVRLLKVGQGRESYSCRPECQPAPVLGDTLDFVENFGSNSDPISSPLASGAISSAPMGQNFTGSNGPR